MDLRAPKYSDSSQLPFLKYCLPLCAGAFIKYLPLRRNQEFRDASSPPEFGRIVRIQSPTSIEINVLSTPSSLPTTIKRRIPPLRLCTVRRVQELVLTDSTKTITIHSVTDPINVFHISEIVEGKRGIISGMKHCFIIRFFYNNRTQTLTIFNTFISFPSQYREYTEIYGFRKCEYHELFEVRHEIQDYLQTILCYGSNDQGTGSAVMQRRRYSSFGKAKWDMVLNLVANYATPGFIPPLIRKEGKKSFSVLRPNMSRSANRRVVKKDRLVFMYPQDMELCEYMFLKFVEFYVLLHSLSYVFSVSFIW